MNNNSVYIIVDVGREEEKKSINESQSVDRNAMIIPLSVIY